ncbi:hypothetical protein [Brevibacillus parabrevis]|uniref:Spore coat protein n=1 Tax=Brevibacillus parabrevis TaxID=54914 RepID=A0A4Y3PNW0_BREPA|nr:hypothetical protein [Brevibacillus parabrevis]RNB94958.1 hypothetical protein EDM60_13865 [Brevibacillus parabrevis]GEB34565.1 hypothetical protein BPA01_41450 [Brevibacillus parabrevis]
MEEKELLQEQYGFQLQNYRVTGASKVLETDQGLYYMFEAPAGYRYKSKFIEKVRKHLEQQKDIRMLKLVKTTGGQPHFVEDEQLYYLYRGVRESVPENSFYASGQSLAQFHQATKNFSGEKLFIPYSSLGNWPSTWRRKLRHYNEYRDELDESNAELTPMDELLLTCYTYVHQLGEISVQYLLEAGYDKVVKETAGLGKVAYQNFDQGYMLWNEKDVRLMAGEWNWVLDMRARDLGQWLKAETKRNGWDDEAVIHFLDGYNSVAPLLTGEYAVIYALMLYPGRFLKLVESYKELPLEERQEVNAEGWQSQLEDELAKMEEGLRRYPRLVADHYGVTIPQIDWLWRQNNEQATSIRHEETDQ